MTARITSGQRDRILELVRARVAKVIDACDLDIDGAQLVITNGDELGKIVGDATRSAITRLAVSQEYAGEEVQSNWGYPDEYTGPAPIMDQVRTIASIYGLSLEETLQFVDQVLPMLTLPDGAEGWFAIPKVDAIAARHFKSVTNPDEQYVRAVLLMLDKIKESRAFYNYRDGQITADRLRQHPRTAAMLERISEVQRGSILVIPSQFGLRHAGRSVRRARAVYAKNEFGHGALAVGSMAIAHPSRFVRWEQFHVDCGGDEFSAQAGGRFGRAPYFYFVGGGYLKFGASGVGCPDGHCGSASGFSPQE